jgi:drug/metabolite transporter (DMT)-like permease
MLDAILSAATPHLGELAALGTAACWAATATSFEIAGRRIGSMVVNLLRLGLAMVFLSGFCAVSRGMPFPTDATAHQWLWLGLSGVVGLTIGDMLLFRAFVLIGARLGILVMSTVPIFATAISWFFLGEQLALVDLAGVAFTVGGVSWVVLERQPDEEAEAGRVRGLGVLLALGGALGQAVGLVLSKHGMGDYDPFAATWIRAAAALVGLLVVFTAWRWWPHLAAAFRDARGLAFTGVGAFFGPFLGVSLSLAAVQLTQVGVASTLMALVPILMLPIAALRGAERITPRAVLGTVLAVGGASLLFV